MRFTVMPRWFKQTIAIAGWLLALPGILIGFGLLCLTLLLTVDNDSGTVVAGLIGFTLMALIVGTGGAIFWHGVASLNGKISKVIPLPPIWGLVGGFVLLLVIGVTIYESDFVGGLFFPPIVLVAAAVPSILAVVWFTGSRQAESVTWRRGIVTFTGAATLSLVIFVIVEFVILFASSMLYANPVEVMINTLDLVVGGLVGDNGSLRMLDRRFAYVFVQITIIIPLIGALAKPVVTVPLLGQLSRRETFLLGAVAGAGFATLENILLAGYGLRIWAWILIIQALGAAIHPLGSGLIALGWRDLVRGKSNAWSTWLALFGIAVALDSLWSLGFLLVISRNSLYFLGEFGPTFILWGGVVIGLTVVVLNGLAVGTLWAGRSIGQQLSRVPGTFKSESVANRLTLFDRGVAIWALASLVAILPVGIIGLQSFLR